MKQEDPGKWTQAEALARFMHDKYELLAEKMGWKTQDSCRGRRWEDLPEDNQKVMVAVAEEVILWEQLNLNATVSSALVFDLANAQREALEARQRETKIREVLTTVRMQFEKMAVLDGIRVEFDKLDDMDDLGKSVRLA
jgi:hypothetical protein